MSLPPLSRIYSIASKAASNSAEHCAPQSTLHPINPLKGACRLFSNRDRASAGCSLPEQATILQHQHASSAQRPVYHATKSTLKQGAVVANHTGVGAWPKMMCKASAAALIKAADTEHLQSATSTRQHHPRASRSCLGVGVLAGGLDQSPDWSHPSVRLHLRAVYSPSPPSHLWRCLAP